MVRQYNKVQFAFIYWLLTSWVLLSSIGFVYDMVTSIFFLSFLFFGNFHIFPLFINWLWLLKHLNLVTAKVFIVITELLFLLFDWFLYLDYFWKNQFHRLCQTWGIKCSLIIFSTSPDKYWRSLSFNSQIYTFSFSMLLSFIILSP